MLSEKEFKEKENELDEEMKTIWENPCVDGITEYSLYKDEPVKILWILKEKNGSDCSITHRDFHIDVRRYTRWQATYANIMYVSYGIREGIKYFSEIPHINKEVCTIGKENEIVLDKIAIININKSGGGSRTPKGKMIKEYERPGVKDFLFKQIEFINPDIIINTHGVENFFNDQVGSNEIINFEYNAERYAINKNKLIIWTTHPCGAHQESYCNNILNIINNVRSKNTVAFITKFCCIKYFAKIPHSFYQNKEFSSLFPCHFYKIVESDAFPVFVIIPLQSKYLSSINFT
ncbi:hypothetical protein [Treponema sp. R80B11-R83G3]